MTTPTLKPCPFCGATAKYRDEPAFGNVATIYHASNCILNRSHDVLVVGTYEAELWNRRAPDPDIVELRKLLAYAVDYNVDHNTEWRDKAKAALQKASER